jgi:hypothetical protein
VEKLRKTGLSFVDFTTAKESIILLMSGRKIYIKSLKKRAPRLTAKIVLLNAKGKNIQELD